MQPIIKACFVFPQALTLVYAAIFGWAVGENIGLVFSEYTAAAMLFVFFLTYVTYGQKITTVDIIGLVIIILAVFDVTAGGEWEREKEDPRNGHADEPSADDRIEEHKDMAISAALAITAGLVQAF